MDNAPEVVLPLVDFDEDSITTDGVIAYLAGYTNPPHTSVYRMAAYLKWSFGPAAPLATDAEWLAEAVRLDQLLVATMQENIVRIKAEYNI